MTRGPRVRLHTTKAVKNERTRTNRAQPLRRARNGAAARGPRRRRKKRAKAQQWTSLRLPKHLCTPRTPGERFLLPARRMRWLLRTRRVAANRAATTVECRTPPRNGRRLRKRRKRHRRLLSTATGREQTRCRTRHLITEGRLFGKLPVVSSRLTRPAGPRFLASPPLVPRSVRSRLTEEKTRLRSRTVTIC